NIARQNVNQRPASSGEQVEQQKALPGHVERACNKRYDRAYRPDKPTNNDALAAMVQKEGFAPRDHARVPLKGPDRVQSPLQCSAYCEAQNVSGDGPCSGPRQSF